MSGDSFRRGGVAGETLPATDGDGRPLSGYQLFNYWEAGYVDGKAGRAPHRWKKRSWPEDGRDAYYEGHAVGIGWRRRNVASTDFGVPGGVE